MSLFSFFALLLCGVTGVSAQQGAQRTLDRVTQRQRLDNGLEVIVVENHAVPIATAEIVVRTGAMTQDIQTQGVPHLYEHMLFRVYEENDGKSFGQRMGELHAGYNGETSEENVNYYLTFPSRNTENAVKVLARLVREPHFEKMSLLKERPVVMGEFQRDVSDPRFHLNQEVSRRLWGSSWPQKNTIGDPIAILTVTPQRLQEIFQLFYIPNNTALVVTGDVSAPKVFAMAQKHFGGWKQRADPFAEHPVPAVAPLDSSRMVVLTAPDIEDVTLEIMWQGPSMRKDPSATYDADALSDLLNDEESDFQKHLVDRGFFQGIHVGYETLDHVGPITMRATTTVKQLTDALAMLSGELTLMRSDDYFDPYLLEKAKKRRSVGQVFALEEGAALAHSVGDFWAVSGLDYYLTYSENLSKRSVKDLQAFADRYLVNRPYVIGALAPENNAKQVNDLLQQFVAFTQGEK